MLLLPHEPTWVLRRHCHDAISDRSSRRSRALAPRTPQRLEVLRAPTSASRCRPSFCSCARCVSGAEVAGCPGPGCAGVCRDPAGAPHAGAGGPVLGSARADRRVQPGPGHASAWRTSGPPEESRRARQATRAQPRPQGVCPPPVREARAVRGTRRRHGVRSGAASASRVTTRASRCRRNQPLTENRSFSVKGEWSSLYRAVEQTGGGVPRGC
jgi:hypothetical protein